MLRRFAHDLFAVALVIIPRVVEKSQALVEGGVHDLDGFLSVLDGADVPAAQANNRDLLAGLAQRASRQSLGGSVVVGSVGAGGGGQAAPAAREACRNSRRLFGVSLMVVLLM